MSLISDYIADRLKAGEDIPIPTMKLAVKLSAGGYAHEEFTHNRYIVNWILMHEYLCIENETRPTAQYTEARRLAMLPFD